MTIVATTLAVLAGLVVAGWVGLFGMLGAVVGERRGRSRSRGFLLGVLGGPVGLVWMLLRAPSPHTASDPSRATSAFAGAVSVDKMPSSRARQETPASDVSEVVDDFDI